MEAHSSSSSSGAFLERAPLTRHLLNVRMDPASLRDAGYDRRTNPIELVPTNPAGFSIHRAGHRYETPFEPAPIDGAELLLELNVWIQRVRPREGRIFTAQRTDG